MKTLTWVILAAAAVVFAGCVVTSVYPYYTPKDLVFETTLLGNWVNTNNEDEMWKFKKSGELEYRVTLIEARQTTVMEAHAFKLHDELFLDLFSLEQDFHVVPAHYLLKVTQITPTLRMSELNDEWLKALLLKEPAALRHILDGKSDKPEECRLVLTADTLELQDFLVRHLESEGAWKKSFELIRDPIGNSRFARVAPGSPRNDVRQENATSAPELGGL
jgi:hypothetical protein